ncbi:hypothetical protein Tco_1250655, partial [Tanacetum coccineum]
MRIVCNPELMVFHVAVEVTICVADSEFMKVVAFGVHAAYFHMLLQRHSPDMTKILIHKVWRWFHVAVVQSFEIVTTSRYVVPTGRVKVPAGSYVVPTGKDKFIVSADRTKVIPAVLYNLYRLEDLSRAGPTMCDEFAKIMYDEFEMSMMGELNFFLGLQIKQMEDGI